MTPGQESCVSRILSQQCRGGQCLADDNITGCHARLNITLVCNCHYLHLPLTELLTATASHSNVIIETVLQHSRLCPELSMKLSTSTTTRELYTDRLEWRNYGNIVNLAILLVTAYILHHSNWLSHIEFMQSRGQCAKSVLVIRRMGPTQHSRNPKILNTILHNIIKISGNITIMNRENGKSVLL